MDESPRQLIRETRLALPVKAGAAARHDYERCRVCNVFMAVEPLAGRRVTRITPRKTSTDWASFLQEIAGHYGAAQKITLVMDNLNTHTPGSLYETFTPEAAKALWDRFEFVYTPKHGSWLNMAEIELNVLISSAWTEGSTRLPRSRPKRRHGRTEGTTSRRPSTGSSRAETPESS